jgi:hypothetical protein
MPDTPKFYSIDWGQIKVVYPARVIDLFLSPFLKKKEG